MLILGVESSCDETALALVKNGKTVIGSIIASQTEIHAKWGGVIPEIAAREHLTALREIYGKLLRESGTKPENVDAIGVTQGPGLIGCLLVGASFAKGLGQATGKQVIPVNHVHAHVHGALLGIDAELSDVFPTLALVVSGGHTNLYYMRSPVDFELMAHTIDDACGESFDKVGKMMGLPYPGGPHVESLAATAVAHSVRMPRMVEKKSNLAFSYSGLKTAVATAIRNSETSENGFAEIAWAFQEEALGQLVRKLLSALNLRPDVKSIIIAGGVSANGRFRELMHKTFNLPVWFPPLKYCSDNGAMIAAMAYYEYRSGRTGTSLEWDVFSRYPFETFLADDLKKDASS